MSYTDEELEGMRQAYLQVSALHDRSFEQCVADPLVSRCLWNTALAVRRAREQARRMDPANFELAP